MAKTNIPLRSPIRWFGGKGQLVRRLLPVLDGIPHRHYCEPFGGGASVLLAKAPPGGVETYNDIDGALYDFFTVLADPEDFERFYRLVALLPVSRRIYNEYRATWRDERDRIKRVAKWYYIARQSFGGHFAHSFGTVVTNADNNMASTSSKWLSILEMLPEIHARLRRVQIENADWRVVIARYDTPETLFYCDPPYPHSTRRGEKYEYEMTDDDHRELVAALLNIRGRAVVSSYPNVLYAPLEDAGWRRIEWQTACYAAARTRGTNILGANAANRMQPRTECVWVSPETQPGIQLAALPTPTQAASDNHRNLPLFTWTDEAPCREQN